jgi:hypothetical protein
MIKTTRPLVEGPEHVSAGRSLVLDELGGPSTEVRHLPEGDRMVAYELAHELRCLCGSLNRAPDGYDLQPLRTCWRRLRDVDAGSLRQTVRKLERVHAGTWRLPGKSDQSIHEQLEAFLQ